MNKGLSEFKNRIFDKRSGKNIPVVVIDFKVNRLFKFSSINEAARFLDAHPTTIWRKIQKDELYLGRYRIVISNKGLYFRITNIVIEYLLRYLIYNLKLYKTLIVYFIILSIMIYINYDILVSFIFICNNVFNSYIKYILLTKIVKMEYFF